MYNYLTVLNYSYNLNKEISKKVTHTMCFRTLLFAIYSKGRGIVT